MGASVEKSPFYVVFTAFFFGFDTFQSMRDFLLCNGFFHLIMEEYAQIFSKNHKKIEFFKNSVLNMLELCIKIVIVGDARHFRAPKT